YLDFGSGQMAAALGHNHPRYVAAVERSLRTISHSTKTFLNLDRLELHERLGQILTPPLQKTLFLVSGSDAIEAAIDLARKATGIVVPPPGYVKLLKQYCRERGMLLIMDESQTGLGKTGKMWGHLHEDVVPDIMTVSKHFGAGLPISAVCTTAEIAERAVENG